MHSAAEIIATRPGVGPMPFASYAQICRMAMPPIRRVAFYDAKGRALWISDGVEEPEFRMHLDLVFARFAANHLEELPGAYSASDQPEPIYVFPIRDSNQSLLGAIGLVCRELPSTAAYRRFEHVERLLRPLIDILSHVWQVQLESKPPPREIKTGTIAAAPAPVADTATPLPALLRRTLALATRSLQCSFGAVVAAERPFTLSHRVSPDESDLAINAAIDNIRANVIRRMKERGEPAISNVAGSVRTQHLPYKVLALPLMAGQDRLAAVLIVFRDKRSPDFGSAELEVLSRIAAQLPANALAELIPKTPPTPARIEEPRVEAAQRAAPKPPAVPVLTSTPTPAPIAKPAVQNAPTGQSTAPKPSVPKMQATAPARIAAPAPTPAARPATRPATPATSVQPSTKAATHARTESAPRIVQAAATTHAPDSMDERIRTALREDGFDLYVQKISPLRDTRRAERFEVLLRMHDGETLQPPQAFFAAAEASELMPELDRWVFRRLMTTLRQRAVTLRTTCWEFSINIAAQSLLTDRFGDFVIAELQSSSVPAGLLVFEISEGDAIEHQYSLTLLAKRLRDAGCRIALDNCRAGLRTFDSVHKWPVSCLKIDGSLIRNVASNGRYESQVRAVAKQAHQMGIETVAECVESESIHHLLLGMGIDYAQGFHLARPQPLASLFRGF